MSTAFKPPGVTVWKPSINTVEVGEPLEGRIKERPIVPVPEVPRAVVFVHAGPGGGPLFRLTVQPVLEFA